MTLPWIKVFNTLPDHPKSDLLASTLGVDRAWSHVVQLWLWASRVRPNGDLSGISDAVVAYRSGWLGDAAVFCDGLRAAGFLDESRTLHDWGEVQGAYLRKLARDKASKQVKRTAKPKGKDVSSTNGAPTNGVEEKRGEEKRGEESVGERSPQVSSTSPHAPTDRLAAVAKSAEPQPEAPQQDPSTNGAPTAERRRSDVAATALRQRADGAPTSDGRRADVAQTVASVAAKRSRGVVGLVEQEQEPKSFEELCAAPHRKAGTVLEHFRQKFSAYDGQNGRRDIEDVLLLAFEHFQKMPSWERPPWPHLRMARFDQWLSEDYADAERSRDRERKAALVGPTGFVQNGSPEAVAAYVNRPSRAADEARAADHRAYREAMQRAGIAQQPFPWRTVALWLEAGAPGRVDEQTQVAADDEPTVSVTALLRGATDQKTIASSKR
jgi:hypothetical protein